MEWGRRRDRERKEENNSSRVIKNVVNVPTAHRPFSSSDQQARPHARISPCPSRLAMTATPSVMSRLSRALRAARAASASTSGSARTSARACADPTFAARRYSGYGKPPDPTRLHADKHHPAFPTKPTWSTAELLHPRREARGVSSEERDDDEVTESELATVARQANLPPPTGEAAKDATRGLNEILRFVRHLDSVQNVDHLEPMWTTLGEDHIVQSREDEVVDAVAVDAAAEVADGAHEFGKSNENKICFPSGWAALRRDDLLAPAPERTRRRAPHFVAATGIKADASSDTALSIVEEEEG